MWDGLACGDLLFMACISIIAVAAGNRSLLLTLIIMSGMTYGLWVPSRLGGDYSRDTNAMNKSTVNFRWIASHHGHAVSRQGYMSEGY